MQLNDVSLVVSIALTDLARRRAKEESLRINTKQSSRVTEELDSKPKNNGNN